MRVIGRAKIENDRFAHRHRKIVRRVLARWSNGLHQGLNDCVVVGA